MDTRFIDVETLHRAADGIAMEAGPQEEAIIEFVQESTFRGPDGEVVPMDRASVIYGIAVGLLAVRLNDETKAVPDGH